eukprot:6886516-Lingulodinium_polyedra.AAC.1
MDRAPSCPTRRLEKYDAETIARWRVDKHRYPVFACGAYCLLWRGVEWRKPAAEVREFLQGLPEGGQAQP